MHIIGIPLGFIHLLLMGVFLFTGMLISSDIDSPRTPAPSYGMEEDLELQLRILEKEMALREAENRAYQQRFTVFPVVISILFNIFTLVASALTFFLLKSKKAKTLGGIGAGIGVIMLVWSILIIQSPGHMSFDEVGPAFIAFSVWMIVLSSIGFRIAKNEKENGYNPLNPDVLDDF